MLDSRIKTFITVADNGSFAKAGEQLFLSSVSVIKQINSLEDKLGFKLVNRTHRGISLTDAGVSFYEDCLRLTDLSRAAIMRAQTISGTEQQVIRVGTSIMRPCNALMERWDMLNDGTLPFRIEIVPFDDNPQAVVDIVENFGKTIDCFIGAYGTSKFERKCSIFHLGWSRCMIAVPKAHHLSAKKKLTWKDIEGESLLLVKEGLSDDIDSIRNDIRDNHPGIKIVSYDHLYDIAVFNQCISRNILMESPEFWSGLHPSIITLPMDWEYRIPYGLLYSKEPTDSMRSFINALKA